MSFNEKKNNKIIKKWRTYMNWTRRKAVYHIGENNYVRFYEESLNELINILPDLPVFKSKVNNMNFNAVPFVISQYKTLTDVLGYKKEKAYEILSDIVCDLCRQEIENSKLTKLSYACIHCFPDFFGSLMARRIDVNEKHGWLFKFPKGKFFMGFNCVQCGALLWLQKARCPEICGILCLTDYITAEYMGLKLIRTKTLAYGDDMCDFKYYRENKCPKIDPSILK